MSEQNQQDPDNVLAYVEDSIETIETLENENKELKEKLAQLQEKNVELEKVASEQNDDTDDTGSILDEEKVNSMLDELQKLAFIDKDGSEQLKNLVYEDPQNIIDVVTKVATISLEATPSGQSVNKISDNHDNSDPHGWKEFFAIKPVV